MVCRTAGPTLIVPPIRAIWTSRDTYNSACRASWISRNHLLNNSKWRFVEIAENTYFCDRGDNPVSPNVYSSVDGSKTFTIYSDGRARWQIDTNQEWRNGCDLSKFDAGGNPPKYPDPNTNWPHFIIDQDIKNSAIFDGKVWPSDYDSLIYTTSVKLNSTQKTGAECSADSWINHELYYMAYVIHHKDYPNAIGHNLNINTIYALVPIFYSNDGSQNTNGSEFIISDQYGNVTYFAPSSDYPFLTVGNWTTYSIDAKKMLNGALATFAETYQETFYSADFYISEILQGWEIWGGYKSDIEAANFSLGATKSQYSFLSPDVTGYFDIATCDVALGWAGDKDNPNAPVNVKFYYDSIDDSHYLGVASANQPREKEVCQLLGGQNCDACPSNQPQCLHAFSFPTPQIVKDGGQHTIYALGENLDDTPGHEVQLTNSFQINCGDATSPSAPSGVSVR